MYIHTHSIDYTDFGLFKDPPKLIDLINFVGADCQAFWMAIGQLLEIKQGHLQAIQLQRAGQPSAALSSITAVFIQWRDGMTSEYSWKKLAEVLCSPAVNKPLQLQKMYTELIKKQ